MLCMLNTQSKLGTGNRVDWRSHDPCQAPPIHILWKFIVSIARRALMNQQNYQNTDYELKLGKQMPK